MFKQSVAVCTRMILFHVQSIAAWRHCHPLHHTWQLIAFVCFNVMVNAVSLRLFVLLHIFSVVPATAPRTLIVNKYNPRTATQSERLFRHACRHLATPYQGTAKHVARFQGWKCAFWNVGGEKTSDHFFRFFSGSLALFLFCANFKLPSSQPCRAASQFAKRQIKYNSSSNKHQQQAVRVFQKLWETLGLRQADT